jgi:hypothetical protein
MHDPPNRPSTQCLLWWGTLYLIFLWIYGASTGTWRYGLNIQRGRAAGAMALLPVIAFLTWLVWYGLARAREAGLCAACHTGGALRRRRRRGGGGGGGGGGPGALALPRADTLARAGARLARGGPGGGGSGSGQEKA